MTQLIIDDFKLGLDVRRSVLTAPAGSLQTLDNCVINAGGEIEKRAAFIATTTLPAGTYGCYGLHGQIHVFGYGAPPVINQGTSPYPIVYHQLAGDGGRTILRILSVEAYQYKFMVVVQHTDGTVANYWDGVLVYRPAAPIGEGNFVYLYKSKMYRTTGPVLAFAGVGDPSMSDPANTTSPGAGFIDLSADDSQTENLAGMEAYYKQVAVFSRLTTQMWSLDPDPSQDTLQQVLRIGAACPRSIVQFGTGDVLFVSDSGIRSLRAINASMAAAVNDVGSPIDKLVMANIASIGDLWTPCSIVTPISGRYVIAFGTTAYVLSYFPAAKISAWSTWTLPVWADYLTAVYNRIIMRSGNTLYMYGGPDGTQYDASVATVVTPMMAADSPTLWKKPISIDLMVQGVWQLQAGMLANNPNARELVGTFNGQTYSLQAIPYAGYGTHIGLTLTTTDPSPALLGSITVNFQKADLK